MTHGRGNTLTRAVVLGALAWIGCGDGDAVDGDDGGIDAGRARGPEIPWLVDGAPPLRFAPCPEGFREVVEGPITRCNPYPEAGPATCVAGEAHFVGAPGCAPLGSACPSGDFADALPSTGRIVHVRAGAPPGGDGSRDAPLASLAEVPWLSLAPGDTVALARGRYDGTLPLRPGVTVLGACAAETVVTGADGPIQSVVSVSAAGEAATVSSLTIADAPQVGAWVDQGRTLVLRGVAIERATRGGVYVSDAGSSVRLERVVVRDTQPEAGRYGHGVVAEAGGRVDAEALFLERNVEVALAVADEGTVAMLTNLTVLATAPRASDGVFGDALAVRNAAHVEVARFYAAENHSAAVTGAGAGATVIVTDAILRDTGPNPRTGAYGRGIDATMGATISATRVVIARAHESGVTVIDLGSAVTLEDVIVEETLGRVGDGTGGFGIGVQAGGSLSAKRTLIAASHEVGLGVRDADSAAVLEDVAIRDTRARISDDAYGYGVVVQNQAHLDGIRVVVDGARELGVASTADASLTLEDASIRGVQRSACDCPDRVFGHGLAALSANARLSRFEVAEVDSCGIFLARVIATPNVDLVSGTIHDTEIGVCLQVDGYDLGRLTDDVEYRDNATNLDTTMLPVPPPLGAL